MYVNVGKLEIGSKIRIRKHNDYIFSSTEMTMNGMHQEIDVSIIGRFYSGEMCIGWSELERKVFRLSENEGNKLSALVCEKWKDHKYDMIDEPWSIDHYKWLGKNVKVKLVFFPDQKCVGCNLPAPHGKANMPDNKFQCLSCKVLELLE